MIDIDVGSLVCLKNNQFIVFNKPPGVAVQSNSGDDFHKLVNAYAKRNLFLVHRIDQPVSGLVLFARNKNAASLLSTQVASGLIERTYHAIVSAKPDLESGVLTNYLLHHKKSNKSIVVEKDTDGSKLSQLQYRYLSSSDAYHLLEIKLISGRTHQIRVQLAAAGMPVKGDVKYGARRSNKDRSIHLHASEMVLKHPISQEKLIIQAPWPDEVLWNFFRPSEDSQH